MAHKKGQGSTKNGRDSNPQYRGIKLYGGEEARPGAIIVRQVGTPFRAGFNVKMGADNTLYSVATGRVVFQSRPSGYSVHVDPPEAEAPRPQWLREYRSARAGA